MSLLNFPTPSASEQSYSLQEFNGQILNGSRKDFEILQGSNFLSDYPLIERSNLSRLQHSLSRDNVKNTGPFPPNLHTRTNEEDASTSTESSWSLSKAVLRVRNRVGSILSKMSESEDSTLVRLNEFATTRNWSTAWLRCIAADSKGSKLAVCQATDYIRVYYLGAGARATPPLTLHHAQQKNVSTMQFDPQDSRILAVAASSVVIVWRIAGKMTSNRSSVSCVGVVSTGLSPLTSLTWDSSSPNTLIASSCTSNKLALVDVPSGEVSSICAWLGGSVTGLYPSPDSARIAVTYTSNLIRVYDRETWREEKWSGLEGRATGVVWAPGGQALIFSSAGSSLLYSIVFTSKTLISEEGVRRKVWVGESRAHVVYDLSRVEFDPIEGASEEMLERGRLGPVVSIGGPVRSMVMSEDGERIAVTFMDRDCASMVAVLIVDWSDSVRLLPCGFVQASFMGVPDIVTFIPQFTAGSMLAISWSGGTLQYVPLIYGKSPAAMALSVHPLVEQHSITPILEESAWHGDSLASVDLSPRLSSDSPICYSDILKERSRHGQLL